LFRNISGGGLQLALQVGPEMQYIFRCALASAAGQGGIDRSKIESSRPYLVQIVDSLIVGIHHEFVPGVNQARGIKDGAHVGLAL
jgi:hypothetical protein